jgi:hypothetical protein
MANTLHFWQGSLLGLSKNAWIGQSGQKRNPALIFWYFFIKKKSTYKTL